MQETIELSRLEDAMEDANRVIEEPARFRRSASTNIKT